MSRLVVLALAAISLSAGCKTVRQPPAADPSKTATLGEFGRDSVVKLLTDLRHIGTPEGIDTLFPLEIEGSKQWISIRGLNRANPALLLIHGGPGSPMMPLAWAYQKPWEDFFTVIQWEQRTAGKNFLMTDTAAVAESFTMDRMVEDAAAVIEAARKILAKEKVVVLGFSWGSVLGTHLASERPDLLHAYVGVGQASNTGEKYLYDRVMTLAKFHRNDTAIKELEAIAPYPAADGNTPEKSLRLARKWAGVYNGGWYGQPDIDLFYRLPRLAPEYSAADVAVNREAQRFSGGKVMKAMMGDTVTRFPPFKIPILILQGRYDLFTPFEGARQLYGEIEAPLKRFIPFERSSHFVMLEEPGRFLMTLVNEVLPLTKEGTTFPIAPDAPR